MLYTLKSNKATPPKRGTTNSAGVDLYSAENVKINAKSHALVSTDLAIKLPKGCYGRIAPKSGLALYHAIDIGAGVIDNDYTGVIKIVVFNHGCRDYIITKGVQIAQLICEKIVIPKLKEISKIENDTIRGDKGFGSTTRNY